MLEKTGLADPHVLMRHAWDDDLRERLSAEAPPLVVHHSFTRRLSSKAQQPADPLISARRELSRVARLQPGVLGQSDVLDGAFLSSPDLATRFREEVVAPYVARYWQLGDRLHPRALPHLVTCEPIRLQIKAEMQLVSAEIALANFQRVCPEQFSYRVATSVEDDWPMPGDDARLLFRWSSPIATDVHKANRNAGKPVIYAMDDDLLNLHEYEQYGESYFNTARQNIIDMIRDADHVITWSPNLANVVRPYNDAVSALTTNIPSRWLSISASPPPADGRLIYTMLTSEISHRADMWEMVVDEWADFFRRHRDRVRLVLYGSAQQDAQYYRHWFQGVDYVLRPALVDEI